MTEEILTIHFKARYNRYHHRQWILKMGNPAVFRNAIPGNNGIVCVFFHFRPFGKERYDSWSGY